MDLIVQVIITFIYIISKETKESQKKKKKKKKETKKKKKKKKKIPNFQIKIVCPACITNQGICNDGINGDGKCICNGNFDGPLCNECKANSGGHNCTSFFFFSCKTQINRN